MATVRPFLRVIALVVVAVPLLQGCTDSEIIFRDREVFNPPADSVNGFVGYFRQSENLTSCGNCHVGTQSQWENTAHADAWAGLQASGHAQPFCEGCHTVSELGNPVATEAGWNAEPDSAYHDVQCESCHGPGLEHVQVPDASQPIASIDVGTSLTTSCGECHQGSHHPFAEEWEQSAHATVVTRAVDRDNPEFCITCHTAQGALEAWGVETTYLEQDDAPLEHLGITCAVCHDPHGSGNPAQLRFPVDNSSVETNLCMKCHHKRAAPEVDASTLRGPHSPEGPLLLGEGAGWFPPGFEPEIDRIVASHGTTGNPNSCATCHVNSFTVADEETGDFVFSATGHLFLAIPCVDAEGIPTTSQNCTVNEREFGGCATSGCHADVSAARSAFTVAGNRIDNLVQTIDSLLALPGPAAERDGSDGIFTVADGAWFNARLGELPGSPTHNPFLIEALLTASVSALTTEYSLAPMPADFMEPVIQ